MNSIRTTAVRPPVIVKRSQRVEVTFKVTVTWAAGLVHATVVTPSGDVVESSAPDRGERGDLVARDAVRAVLGDRAVPWVRELTSSAQVETFTVRAA